MEPSDQYLKSKRNLVLFSGLLLLSATVGLNVVAEESGSHFLPIALRDANYFDDVIALLVIYFAYQMMLFWYAQATTVRRLMHYKIDFGASIVMAGISVTLYASQFVGNVSFGDAISGWWDRRNLIVGGIFVFLVMYGMLATAKLFIDLADIRRETSERRIIGLLTNSSWFLIFNPTLPGRSKKIAFLENEEIAEGKNDNEHSWRVRAGLLEILNEGGQVFSRFSYDRDKGIFFHTNDEDTLSLRSQRIEPFSPTS
jgi:hypothetical protein